MNNEQKERLEQELTFLKESLEADVISKDEYEKGRERIERKLNEVEESGEPEEASVIEEQKIRDFPASSPNESEEHKAEEVKPEEDEPEEPKIEIKEIEEQPTKIIVAGGEKPTEEQESPKSKVFGDLDEKPQSEEKEEEKEKPTPQFQNEEPTTQKEEPTTQEKSPEEEQKIEDQPTPESDDSEEIKISKKWLYGIAILIIVAILFFSIRGRTSSIEETPLEEEIIGEIEEFTPECSSDTDCKKEGMVSTCLEPGKKEAKCEFKQDIETNLIVINDKDCKLCDSSRTKTIAKSIFPNVKIMEIDYETEEAKELLNKLDIITLPAYIFDSKVSEAINFNDFKSALTKKEDNYVMSSTASGSDYYFKRPLIENKLDLYVLPETNGETESAVQEVLDLFKDKINFTKHIVTEREKELLEKELAINTYPSFLINNQLKFRGILPANMIKEKICEVNLFEECSQELSKI